MGTKSKGMFKGFNKYISQMFVVKEREMEIGFPTDCKHVAHIGWDGPNGSGPSWMNEFKSAPNFSTSIGSLNDPRDPNSRAVSNQDFQDPRAGNQPTPRMYQDIPSGGASHVPKKPKKKKTKSSSPKSSSRQSRAAKSKTNQLYCERETNNNYQL